MKRKQRDIGDSKSSTLEPFTLALDKAREEALFRSAYSSFAPSFDDGAAIVPSSTKGRLWWQRFGEKLFQDSFGATSSSVTSTEATSTQPSDEPHGEEGKDEEELFREAVEAFVPEDAIIDPQLTDPKLVAENSEDIEVDKILQDISELLETLNSYRRIRNLSTTSKSRQASVPNGEIPTASSASTPSSAEFDTYSLLKAQLSLLIGMLPPYAVAKLNSDQLADLNISAKLLVELPDYKGVLEEDEITTKAKAAAASAVRPVQTPSHGYPRQSYPVQNTQPRHNSQVSHQYYQPQTPARPSSAAMQRPPATAPPQYAARPPSSASPRPVGTGFNQQVYGQHTPRPQQPYGQTNPSQYFQQNSHGYAQPQQNPQNRHYQQPSQPAYQQRAQQAVTNYGYNIPGRQSPQKPQQYTPQPQNQSRPSYATPALPQQHQQRYFQDSQPNQTPRPQQGNTVGVSGYHTYMTPEQQASMMERQRATLAQQHARTQAQLNVIGTPTPSVPQNQIQTSAMAGGQ
jgi:hypothetical protein